MNTNKNIEKMKEHFKEYGPIILITILVSLLIFSDNIFNNSTFAWYNDQAFQHNIFYKEWFRIIEESIRNHNLSVYSWNTFLGTDYLVSKLMYCVCDYLITPFFIFSILFNISFDFDTLFMVTTILCYIISAITMNMFLKEFGIKKQIYRNGFSLIYAFSGFAIIYSGSYMFHRFYSLLPLLFYFTDRYIEKGYYFGFCLIVAVLFSQSFELMFSTSLFLVFYFIFYYKLKYNLSTSKILKKSILLIFAYLIGIMLCGAILLPLIKFIGSNSRVGNLEFGSLIWDFKTLVSFIAAIVCPAYNFRTDNPPYLFYTNKHFSAEFGIYATMLILLGIVHLYKNGTKKDKRILVTGQVILMLFIMIRPLNMVVHGFSEPTLRWTFLYMLFNIILAAYSFDKYPYIQNYHKLETIILLILIILFSLYFIIYDYSFDDYAITVLIILLSYSTVYICDYFMYAKKDTIAFAVGILCCVLFLNRMVAGKDLYQNDGVAFNKEYLKYFDEEDETKLFRYSFSPEIIYPYSGLNLNASVEYDYRSTSTYDSTYEAILGEFLELNDFDSWIINIEDFDLLKMLGVKYVGVLNEEDLICPENYEYAYNLDNILVYKVKNFNNIGHTYSNFKNDIGLIKDWNNELYVNDEDKKYLDGISFQNKKQLEISEYNRQYFSGCIELESKSVLYIAIPYSDGWNVYNQNGDKLKTLNVQGGFLGVVVDGGYQELNFYYGTPGLKQGIVISLFGFGLSLVLLFSDVKRSKLVEEREIIK